MDTARIASISRPGFVVRLGLAMLALLVAVYAIVFVLTTGTTPADAMRDAVINVIPLGLWGGVFLALNRRWLLDRPVWLQAPLQALAALAFSALWYFSVTIGLGWSAGDFSGTFSVRPFATVAFVWQMFQGVLAYALTACLALVARLVEALAARADTASPDSGEPGTPERILVRTDDELVSVPVRDIVCIERAGDYARLVTADGSHLTRRSLAELERQLPGARFIRVHRSSLINLDALEAAEPIGGGRMRARLIGGRRVDTSRSGARVLRERAG